MHRISESASRSLPRDDLRRYSYKLSYPDEERRGVGQRVLPDVCRCPLPERPDAWSDVTWRKFLTAMARLPCKVCKTEALIPALPTRSSLPRGSTTTSSIMRLLSKGKKHYHKEPKIQNPPARSEEEAEAHHRVPQEQEQQGSPFCSTAPSSGAAAAEGAASTTPSAAVAAVFPRRERGGAAPWEDEEETKINPGETAEFLSRKMLPWFIRISPLEDERKIRDLEVGSASTTVNTQHLTTLDLLAFEVQRQAPQGERKAENNGDVHSVARLGRVFLPLSFARFARLPTETQGAQARAISTTNPKRNVLRAAELFSHAYHNTCGRFTRPRRVSKTWEPRISS